MLTRLPICQLSEVFGSTYLALVCAGIFSESICGGRYLRLDNTRWTKPHRICRSSAMDQHRDFAMSKDLDRLAAEDNRGNAVAAMRSHDD